VTRLDAGPPRELKGHTGNVNAVTFLPDGRVATAGYDATLRLWPREPGEPVVLTLPSPQNAVLTAPDGELAAAGADGILRLLGPDGACGPQSRPGRPRSSRSRSRPTVRGSRASIGGAVAIVERAAAKPCSTSSGRGFRCGRSPSRPTAEELLTGGGTAWSAAGT
jgi:cytochrome c